MHGPRILAFLALLLAPLPPAVALEKCVSPDGRISYSEQPCAAGAKRAPIGRGTSSVVNTPGAALSTYTPPAEVRVNYYDVQGGDYNSVLGSLMSGREFAGKTDWLLSYKYQPRVEAGACKAESVTTKLALSMTLPRWLPPSGAAADLIGRWERFMSALRVHEEGHVQDARNLESGAKRALLALSSSNCGALDSAMRAKFDQLLEQGRARDRDYDQQTGHGKTQGAVFR
jgi:predicted secreted Zn-dependent protease